MSRAYKIKSLFTTVLLTLLVTILTACSGDDTVNINPYKNNSYLRVNTMALKGEAVDGVTASVIRLVVVNRQNSKIVLNKTTSGDLTEEPGTPSGSGKFILNLKSGEYTLCVIANETAAMTGALESAADMSDLKDIVVAGSFGEADVPLYRQQDFIFRVKSNGTDVTAEVSADGGTTWRDELDIELLRTQCKVSLWLRKKTGSPDEVKITKVELRNYPDKSYMITRVYDPAAPQVRSVFENSGGLPLGEDVPDGNDDPSTYTPVFSSGNIFPEQCITSKADASKATYLKIYATYGSLSTSYTVRLRNDLSIENYDLTRNTHYKIYGTIETTGDLSAIYFAPVWETEEVSGDIAVPYLNISEINSNIVTLQKDKNGALTPDNFTFAYDYYFWTNRLSSTIKLSDVTAAHDPDAAKYFTTSLDIVRDDISADGLPDVAGKITVSASVDSEGVNKITSASAPYVYKLKLTAGELTRSVNFIVNIEAVPSFYAPVPSTGAMTITGYGTTNMKATTGTFEIEAYMSDNMEVVSLNPSYYWTVTITEKSRTVNSDSTLKVIYTVTYTMQSSRYATCNNQETIKMRLCKKYTTDVLSETGFLVNITKK